MFDSLSKPGSSWESRRKGPVTRAFLNVSVCVQETTAERDADKEKHLLFRLDQMWQEN